MLKRLRLHHLLTTVLMLAGLVCRIAAGSMPLPPDAPFWNPMDQATVVHAESARAESPKAERSPAVATRTVVKASQPQQDKSHKHVESGTRPWYGLFVTMPEVSPSQLLDIVRTRARIQPPLPDLDSPVRPPSC